MMTAKFGLSIFERFESSEVLTQGCSDVGAAPTTVLDLSAGNLSQPRDPVRFKSAVMLTVARLVVSNVIREATTNTQSKSAQHTKSVGLDLDQSHPRGSAYEV